MNFPFTYFESCPKVGTIFYMKSLSILLLISLFIVSCAKPKGGVYKDSALSEEENVKFCFTGDMGKDTPHQEAIAEALKREECHRIFFLGDLVYPDGIDSINDEEFTGKFLAYYEPLLQENPNLKINLVLGNHDHKGKPEAWKRVSQINERFFFPDYYYMLDYGGLCFVALDTSLYYYLSDVSETTAQTTWIQALQKRLKEDCDVKVAVTHHPFKTVGYDAADDWEGSSGALKTFLDTYVIGVFDIHLAGHVHVVVDDGVDEGTRMLTSGAGGEVRSNNRPGYIVLNWQPDNPKRVSYNIKYVDVEPTVVDETSDAQMQEENPYDHIIRRHAVEGGAVLNLWGKIKAFIEQFL